MAQPTYIQPKFASQIQTLAHPLQKKGSGRLKRGFMIWEKPLPGYKSKTATAVHYLYNPSTVEAMYSVGGTDGNNSQFSQLYPIAGQNSNLVIPMTQSANWTIMFDRTFEIYKNGGNNNKGNQINDPAVAGVGVDVLAMMQFTGMLVNVGKQTSSTSGSNGIWPSVMLLNPSFAYFGGTGNNTVRYYGYINEWDVTYTHWTQNMIPMRCVVDVSWTMLPKPTNAADPTTPNIAYYTDVGNAKSQNATSQVRNAANIGQGSGVGGR